MQLKFSMVLKGRKLTLPSRGEEGRWIVKIPDPNHPELPEIEHCTMRWASRAGFEVPEHRVIDAEDMTPHIKNVRAAFAIQRYDRRDDGARVHQEDFCQIFNLSPLMKYDAPVSYASLARLIHDVCGEAQQREFIQRLAFVVLSGNNDAHLKNWSWLWTDQARPSLSPCYDLVSTVSWLEEQEDFLKDTLALGLIKKQVLPASAPDTVARLRAEDPSTRAPLTGSWTRSNAPETHGPCSQH
jgi:serine/threonine-protein kinase HipA